MPAESEAPFKISVIIPFHRGFVTLRDTLEGIRSQTYPAEAIQVIAVNNNPGDPGIQTMKGDFPEVRWIDEPVPSSYVARNRGLMAADSEWLVFTDSDCLPTPEWLTEGVKEIQAGGWDLLAGRVDLADPSDRSLNACELLEHEFSMLHRQKELVEHLNVVATANLFAKRALFDELGGFATDLMSYGDGEWTRRAVAAGKRLGYADRALVRHPRRSCFREILSKMVRVAGDRVNYLRFQGESEWMVLHDLWRGSFLDPRIYVRILRCSRERPLWQRLQMLAMGGICTFCCMVQKIRVAAGAKAFRG